MILHHRALSDAIGAIVYFIKNNLYDRETYNVLSDNLTVDTIIEIIRQSVPNIQVQNVDPEIMNQLSYEVSSNKIIQKGFKFSGNILEKVFLKQSVYFD